MILVTDYSSFQIHCLENPQESLTGELEEENETLDDDDNSISEDCHDYAELSAEVELESPPSSVGNEQELESRVESEENETLEEIISEGPEPDEELSEENIEESSVGNEQELESLSELEYKPDPPLLSEETETLSSLLEQESEEKETLEEIISEGPVPDEELSEENIEMTSAQSEVVAPTFYEGFLIKLARKVFGREI